MEGRRLIYATLTAATLFAASCGGDGSGKSNAEQPPWLKPVATEQMADADIIRFYPEIQSLKTTERGAFKSKIGTEIRWYNYTDAPFNARAAQEAFEYFQNYLYLPQDRVVVDLESTQGRLRPIVVSARQAETPIPVFIVDKNMPQSAYMDTKKIPTSTGQQEVLGRTIWSESHGKDIPRASFIVRTSGGDNLPDPLFPNTPEAALNRRVLIALCNIAMDVNTLDNQNDDIGEAIWCNGLARTFFARQLDIPYSRYAEEFSQRYSAGYGVPYVDQNHYDNGIPLVGDIVAPR